MRARGPPRTSMAILSLLSTTVKPSSSRGSSQANRDEMGLPCLFSAPGRVHWPWLSVVLMLNGQSCHLFYGLPENEMWTKLK